METAVIETEEQLPVGRLAYTVPEVAAMLGMTSQSVYRLIRAGSLHAKQFGTRNLRVLATDLDDFLSQEKYTTGMGRDNDGE